MLFVPPAIPFMVPEAEAFDLTTVEGCIGMFLSELRSLYTVVTCENPFNVTVNIGQKFRMASEPPGGNHTIYPTETYGGLGTYEWSGNNRSGTITIQNPPDVGVNFVDTTTTISGSQVILTGQIVNNNNFPVRVWSYYHATDDAGNYVSGHLWEETNYAAIPADSSLTFTAPSLGGTQVTPYIVQVIRDYGDSPWSLSGTWLIDVNIYPEADTTPPVVNVPSDQTLIANSPAGITIAELCSVALDTSNTPGVGGADCLPDWHSSLTAYDAVTNSSGSYSQAFTPSCSSSNESGTWHGWINNWWFVTPTYPYGVIPSDRVIPVGTSTITCTATDFAGNTASASFDITVSAPADTTCGPTVSTCNFYFESLNITGDSDNIGPSIIVVVGESWHVTPTLAWEGTLPEQGWGFAAGQPQIKGEIRYTAYADGTPVPSGGTLYGSKNWNMISNGSVDYDAKTVTLDTWSGQFFSHQDWPVGGYLVTITVDSAGEVSETNESDNVIERLDIWSSCDHPPWDADVCVSETSQPNVIATAYLNGTSSTGRTFYMDVTNVGPALEAYGNSL